MWGEGLGHDVVFIRLNGTGFSIEGSGLKGFKGMEVVYVGVYILYVYIYICTKYKTKK